jgi:hypothetical protein
MDSKLYIYAARDTSTGKLVNDITNPGRKFWEKQGNCIKAIEAYNNRTSYSGRCQRHGKLELVVFELKELSK